VAGLTLLQIRARQRVERSEAIVAEASDRFREQAETLETANWRISELLQREREARAEAERVGHEKDEFLATLSHELRTPLAAVVGWSDLLAAGLPADQAAQALAAVRRNARAQLQLVDDLLDMSRIAGGRMRLEPRDVDPREVVEAAVTVTRPAAEAKRVRVETDFAADLPLIRADPARLQQVVWNLLTNAIKFTPSAGLVSVRGGVEGDEVVLTVQDAGAGIDPEFLPHVFDRFRQADASSTRRVGGLGLGLSIVRHLVEMHGGSVEAFSEGPGRGSTFTVRLPRVAAAVAAEAPVRAERRTDTPAPPVSPRLLAGLRILAVDDERDTRDMLYTVLAQHGAHVTAVGSATEALSLLDGDAAVDVIISDLSMPEMDGLELMRRVRQLSCGNSRAAAVALSAFARPEDRSRAILAGFDVHLPKPFEIPALVTTCAALVERSRPGSPGVRPAPGPRP
jgi:signal transduction histidine kinase/ActR/RegA family two-component response regulator